MNGIDAVVFDLGNVLVRVDEALGAGRLAARTGKTREEVERYFYGTPHAAEFGMGKMTRQVFYRTVAQDLGFDGPYEEFARIWAEVFTPIPPMIALAEGLKGRVPRVLLSNTNVIHIEHILETFPFVSEFDDQILSHEVGLLKPDEAIYRLALKRCGLTAEHTVFIDDLVANVEGARRVGMQAIHHQTPEQTRQELTKLGIKPL
jgi:putative hydrolase of the HAD superfamily